MSEILFTVCYVVTVCVFGFLFWRMERSWNEERAKLLDRIQSGSFGEYKAQERADIPIKRQEKDPEIKKWEREPWA